MNSDRNLLFGVLALQMDFVGRDALLAAMNAWALDKDRPLGQVLLDQGQLTPERRQLLDALVAEHVKAHHDDPRQSLAALPDSHLVSATADPPADPPADPNATVEDVSANRVVAGERYRVLRPHARGGLGEVFVAFDEQLRREVALKEMQPRHADNAASRARFLLEAEVTGNLEHPGVVPVYGLGHHADGRPFYVMRFIQGDTLEDAATRFHATRPDFAGLAFRQLLQRFVAVCNAVGYAHSRGVLHRDLKPANILLGKFGEALVVDWGLARATERDGEPAEEGPFTPDGSRPTSHVTVAGTALGTPAYMSPEQAAGRLGQLGPACDVYGLGATLYTLLTGRPPVEGDDVGTVLQKVQRGDWPAPRQLRPTVPPALEAICRKAMALQPEDRYASALSLAADVEHWLADEPVSAWHEPWRQRVRRWAGRHRALASGTAAAVLVGKLSLFVFALVLASAHAREKALHARADEQKARAEENFRLARQAVDDYITKVSEDERLQAHDLEPLRKKLLESAVQFYQKFAAERGADPAVQSERGQALVRLGSITAAIGSVPEAVRLYELAVSVHEALVRDHPDEAVYRGRLATTLHALGGVYKMSGDHGRARQVYERSRDLSEQLVRDDPDNLDYGLLLGIQYNTLGQLLGSGHPAEVAALYGRAIDLLERHPSQRTLAAVVHANLGTLQKEQKQFAAAAASYQRALALREALVREAPHDPNRRAVAAFTDLLLGDLYRHTDRPEEAEAAHTRAVTAYEELARQHPAVTNYRQSLAAAHQTLGQIRHNRGRPDQAEASFKASRDVLEHLVRDHPDVPVYQNNLGALYYTFRGLYQQTNRPRQAEEAARQAVATFARLAQRYPSVPAYAARLALSHTHLGELYEELERPADAEAAYREAMKAWEKQARDWPNEPNHVTDYGGSCHNFGNFLADTKPDEALTWYGRATAVLEDVLGKDPANHAGRKSAATAYRQRARLRERLGRHAEALADRERLVALQEEAPGPHPDDATRRGGLAQLCYELGNAYRQASRRDEARAAYRRAAAVLEPLVGDPAGNEKHVLAMANVVGALGLLELEWRNNEAAEGPYRREVILRERLAAAYPDDPASAVHLGGAHCNLGHVLARTARGPEALRHYDRAATVLGTLRERPGVPEPWHATAVAFLRNTFSGRADVLPGEHAVADLGRAVRLQEQLLQGTNDPGERRHLARLYHRLGGAAQRAGRRGEARRAFERALRLLEQLDARDATTDLRRELAALDAVW